MTDSDWTIAIILGLGVVGALALGYFFGRKYIAQEGASAVQGVIQTAPQALQAIPRPAIMTNKEDIVWTDWKGRERHITIHREVH